MTQSIFLHPGKFPVRSIPLNSMVIATMALPGSCLMAAVGILSGSGGFPLGQSINRLSCLRRERMSTSCTRYTDSQSYRIDRRGSRPLIDPPVK
ncbi:hypothetical protein EVAR_21942_1, partial [Eumeta japonica]